MDLIALIEAQTSVFDKVCAHMKQIHGKAPTSEEAVAVFNTVHAWQMNKAIDAQQTARDEARQQARQTASQTAGSPGQASQAGGSSKPKSDVKCVDCSRFLTVGEKKYCDDADKQYRCYQCTKKRE
jgi:hypothetical protein